MSYFNEDNVTEQMCIAVAKEAGYEYVNADELREAKNDVIVESLLQETLIKINHNAHWACITASPMYSNLKQTIMKKKIQSNLFYN